MTKRNATTLTQQNVLLLNCQILRSGELCKTFFTQFLTGVSVNNVCSLVNFKHEKYNY